eukprot:TRINITY_DN12466_c0_g1_i1.p1 TRINITY_DN12466_c0_g1~~TRINITY_DN12466_c0_g1_i1.p1  ORF type:complete len:729 (+),score=158.11 TRINITY_DN12466_c0_g1_i1:291-2189(+)
MGEDRENRRDAEREHSRADEDKVRNTPLQIPPSLTHSSSSSNKPRRRWCCFPFLYVAAFFAIIGGFNFGYDLGVITNTITPISIEFELSPFRKEVIVSSLLAGAAVGSLAIGWLSDRFGRKRTVIASSALFLVGSLLIGFANNFWTLLTGRVICGLGTGASLVTMIYLAELAPASKRGTIVSSNELSITFGIFLSLAFGKILAGYDEIDGSTTAGVGAAAEVDGDLNNGSNTRLLVVRSLLEMFSSSSSSSNEAIEFNVMTWRIMFFFLAIPSTIQLVGMMFMPESPRWLFEQRRNEEALEVLQKIHDIEDVTVERNAIQKSCSNSNHNSFHNNQSISDLQPGVNEDSGADADSFDKNHAVVEVEEEQSGWRGLFTADMRRRFFVGMGVVFFQQTTGQTTVLYYSSIILESVFSTRTQITTATLLIGVMKMVAALIAMQIIDRVGRRILLLCGTIGAVITLLVIASCFFEVQTSSTSDKLILSETIGWVVIVTMMVYFFMYGLSFGPVGWVLPSEIFPMKVRGQAMSVTCSFNYVINFVVALTFLDLVSAFGQVGAFYFYAGVSFVGLIFVYVFVPETKGKTLEEIQSSLFDQPTSTFSFRRFTSDPRSLFSRQIDVNTISVDNSNREERII